MQPARRSRGGSRAFEHRALHNGQCVSVLRKLATYAWLLLLLPLLAVVIGTARQMLLKSEPFGAAFRVGLVAGAVVLAAEGFAFAADGIAGAFRRRHLQD
jgi:hypothetical protein